MQWQMVLAGTVALWLSAVAAGAAPQTDGVGMQAEGNSRSASGESRLFVESKPGEPSRLTQIRLVPGAPEPVKFAAEELRAYLRKAVGTELPVMEGAPGAGVFFLATADAAPETLARVGGLPADGFDRCVIAVQDGGVCLIGENPRATLYAAYDFLQASLGIRFFGPDDQHEVVPVRDSLVLDGSLRLQKSSAFEFREYYLPHPDGEASVDFLTKNRVNTFCVVASPDQAPSAIRRRGGLVHGPGHIFREFLPDESLFPEHPEYFSVIEGKRTVTGKGACFSNPGVRRIFRDKVRDYIRKRPYWDIFAVWAEDSYYPCYCECPECARVSTGGWYIALINEIAPVVEQELPNALFEFIAYHETRWPPKEVTPLYKNGKNMVLNLCLGYSRNGFYTLASRRDGNAEVADMYAAWSKRLAEIGFEGRRILFDYYNRCEIAAGQGPAGQSLVWPMDVIAEDTRFYLRDGIRGVADWICFDRLCWPTPFNVWAWMQLYSTPDRPLGDLEEDFYPAYFGEAGPEVLAYAHALRDAMYAHTSHDNIEALAALRTGLDALIAAEADAVIRHRLEVVRNHHEYCLLLKRIWLAFMENDEPAWRGMLPAYVDFYPVTHRALLEGEIDIPSQFMNMWTEYHLKRPPEQVPDALKGLVSLPSSR